MRKAAVFITIVGAGVLAGALWAAAAVSSDAKDLNDGAMYWASYHRTKVSVSAAMVDPESARFSDLYFWKHGGHLYLCGSVNAKNRMGGYVGTLPFSFGIRTGPLEIADLADTYSLSRILATCTTS